jgi:DNA repair protein SbcD/Mre11
LRPAARRGRRDRPAGCRSLAPGGRVTGRYAGSLIPIDFGEAVQEKQALVITIADGDVSVDEHALPVGRPLTEFDGTVDQLEALAADGGLNKRILKARVRSDDPITDLAERVLGLSPECAIFDIVNSVANAPVRPVDTSAEADREPDIRELFTEWWSIPTEAGPLPLPACGCSPAGPAGAVRLRPRVSRQPGCGA